jgi:hypothetical protein
VVLLATLALAGCGEDSETDSVAPSNLIAPTEISKYPEGSAERSFLNFWSDLQYQSWADAAAFYTSEFRDFIGTASLIGAKKVDASVFPVTKPELVRVRRHGADTTVSYSLVLPDGTTELGSTTWRRIDGSWQMIYDSRLDAQLNQAARNRVEIAEAGSVAANASEAPSPAVSRAGNRAARLQSEFLEQELDGAG